MVMHGDVRASDADRYAAASRDPWLAADASQAASYPARTRPARGGPGCAAAFCWASPWSP